MSPIRRFERDDVDRVAELYELVQRSGTRTPPPRLAEYFERTFLDHPWVDGELPSLVYEAEGGRIVAFLGSHVRRLHFDGTPIRLACSGQLVRDPEARNKAAGAMLLRHYLSGPQELTITDGATDDVRRMWLALGGRTLRLKSIDWTRILRPGAALSAASGRLGRPAARRAADALLRAAEETGGRLLRGRLQPSEPDLRSEPLTAETILRELPALTRHLRLAPAYDEGYLAWLFREMAAVESRGELRARMYRDGEGQTIGWYVAYLREGATAQVLQVVAADEAGTATVTEGLLTDAWQRGCAAVRGRLEPQLFEAIQTRPISSRTPILHRAEFALIHCQDPALGLAVEDKGLLTRMDGEWWMGHHTESFR